MDPLTTFLISELIKALGEGNLLKFGAYLAIFLVIWLEVRGMKKQLKTLNENFSQFGKKLAEGETRFETIEKNQKDFEHRLTVLEPKPQGG